VAQERNEANSISANPGYARFQIAKALLTSEQNADPAARERARRKIEKWANVLNGMADGALRVGSRTPVGGVPAWATLEVITGGFATGGLLAEGPVQDHERRLLMEIGMADCENDARRILNGFYLSDVGLPQIKEMLRTARYDVNVPEEGVLLVVAWLADQGYVERANELLESIGAFLDRLRFYPVPQAEPRQFGSQVFLRDLRQTRSVLAGIRPNRRILSQREAVLVWAPLYDRLVTLFLETVDGEAPFFERAGGRETPMGGWPCQHYPEGWRDRAQQWLAEFDKLRKTHQLTGKPQRKKEHFSQLVEFARRCVTNPGALTGREVGRIRLILAHFLAKHGQPNSEELQKKRAKHTEEISRPLFSEIAAVLAARLAPLPQDEGLADPQAVAFAVTSDEAQSARLPAGTVVPKSLQRKIAYCLCDTVDALVKAGLITSGEVLARLLPQITAGQRATGFEDPSLRTLYAAIYRAFRRRRSLLLFDLQSQVKLEELPWVAAIEKFRTNSVSDKQTAQRALGELAALAISSFPHVILPNKLLQEMRTLAKASELDLPLVDELAVDIFMGQFSGKFVQAAKQAADLLDGTLYARYFGIDYGPIRRLPLEKEKSPVRRWFSTPASPDAFAQLCAARAGVALGTWRPAINGMIVEQQQIVTSQNLAVLFGGLGLTSILRERLPSMARSCFNWIVRRMQMKTTHPHARLIALKNCAYAWRQMVFFLALMSKTETEAFLVWVEERFQQQPGDFRHKFQPVVRGLKLAAAGLSLDDPVAQQTGARRFLGWSQDGHWLF
jgi:hypothetical protein